MTDKHGLTHKPGPTNRPAHAPRIFPMWRPAHHTRSGRRCIRVHARDCVVHPVSGAARARSGRTLAGDQQGVPWRTDHALGSIPVGGLQAVCHGRGNARARIGQVWVQILLALQAGVGAAVPVCAFQAASFAGDARRRVLTLGKAAIAYRALLGILLVRLQAVGDDGGHARARTRARGRFRGGIRIQPLHAPNAVAVRGMPRSGRPRSSVPVLTLHAPGLAPPTGAILM